MIDEDSQSITIRWGNRDLTLNLTKEFSFLFRAQLSERWRLEVFRMTSRDWNAVLSMVDASGEEIEAIEGNSSRNDSPQAAADSLRSMIIDAMVALNGSEEPPKAELKLVHVEDAIARRQDSKLEEAILLSCDDINHVHPTGASCLLQQLLDVRSALREHFEPSVPIAESVKRMRQELTEANEKLNSLENWMATQENEL